MKNQKMKFAAIPLMTQILRSPRWLAMMFLLPLLAVVHFALAAPTPATPAVVVDKFEHAKIGYNLSGAHIAARCTSCHINNVFKGTPRDCATCHLVGNHMGATAKPTNHVATNVQCDTCHKTTLWTPAFFSHVGISAGTCGTCHNGTNAKGKADSAKPHPLTSLDCASAGCHSGTVSFTGARGALPANHLPTTQSCSLCHASGYGEGSGVMDHLGITNNCNTCHNGQAFAVGVTPKRKQDAPTEHMTTTLDCSNCHPSTSEFSIVTLTTLPTGHFPTIKDCTLCHAAGYGAGSGVMNHLGITNNCIICHNGQTFAVGANPLSKPNGPPAHIPTTSSCEVCHSASQTNGGGFVITTLPMMNHAGITSNCASCHNNGMTFAGTTPKRKQDAAITHVTTALDCSICHNSTATFTGAVMALPTGHLVSSQPCVLCHAAGYGSGQGVMVHTGITNNCTSCHNGQTFAVGMKPMSKPTTHLPTSLACEVCHLASKTSPGGFAGTAMNHAGITNNCASCHNDGMSFAGVTPKRKQDAAITHVTTALDCSICHNSTATFTGAVMALPTGHLVSSQPCVLCHAAGYGSGQGVMVHTGITNNCTSCHNGQTFAVGVKPKSKPTNHIPTTAMTNGAKCETCHAISQTSTGGFSLSVTMSHTGIATGCATCHGGTAFAGGTPLAKPTNHVPTTAVTNGTACETCHTASQTNIGGFTGAPMKHTGITNNCASCHNDGMSFAGVTPKRKQDAPTTHMTTALDCSSCHSSTTTFVGGSPTVLPTGHLVTLQACSLCHAAGYGSGQGVMVHTGITNNCTSCHNGQTFAVGMKPMSKPTTHLPTSLACEVCHLASKTSPGGFAGTAMNHAGISNNCIACHNGQTFAVGVTPMRKQDAPTTHVTTALDCSACHTGTITFKGASGGAMPANHIATAQPCTLCHAAGYSLTLTVMNHLGITTGCANCHNGQSFVGPQTPMKKPTNHIPYAANLLGGAGMQCEFCHKSTIAFTLSVTSTVMHNGSQGKGSGQCTGCHLSGTSYLGVQGRKSLAHEKSGHTDCSDSGCHKPLGSKGSSYTNWD